MIMMFGIMRMVTGFASEDHERISGAVTSIVLGIMLFSVKAIAGSLF